MTNQSSNLPSDTAHDLPERLLSAARTGDLPRTALDQALRRVGYPPSRMDWATFMNNLLLYLGALLLVSGIFFFFAYNWRDLHHFAKFGLIQTGIVAAAGLAHYLGLEKLSGKVSLTVAALLVGVLMAVYGQFYQTGADSYLLFLLWSLLIAGWVLIGRFQPLWFVLIVLCNTAAALFIIQTGPNSEEGFYLLAEVLFGINALFLLGWEIARGQVMGWMENRGLPSVVGLAAVVVVTIPVARTIFEIGRQYSSTSNGLHILITSLLYVAAIVLIFVVYGRFKHDLFMLTIAMFSLIALITSGMVRIWDEIGFNGSIATIVIGLLVVGLTGIAINLLQRLSHSWETSA